MSRGGGFNPLDALFGAASQAANVGAAVASAAATAAANSAVSAANAAASVSTKVLSSEAQFFDETVTVRFARGGGLGRERGRAARRPAGPSRAA